MLDIRYVRDNSDKVKENIKKKFQDEKIPLVDEIYNIQFFSITCNLFHSISN